MTKDEIKGLKEGDRITMTVTCVIGPHGNPRDCGALLQIPIAGLDGPWARVIGLNYDSVETA